MIFQEQKSNIAIEEKYSLDAHLIVQDDKELPNKDEPLFKEKGGCDNEEENDKIKDDDEKSENINNGIINKENIEVNETLKDTNDKIENSDVFNFEDPENVSQRSFCSNESNNGSLTEQQNVDNETANSIKNEDNSNNDIQIPNDNSKDGDNIKENDNIKEDSNNAAESVVKEKPKIKPPKILKKQLSFSNEVEQFSDAHIDSNEEEVTIEKNNLNRQASERRKSLPEHIINKNKRLVRQESSMSIKSQPCFSASPLVSKQLIRVASRGLIRSESENSGSAFITPQQKRRRPVQYPHHRRNRKVSAPPELQAHLGKKSIQNINLASLLSKGGSPNPDSVDNSSVTELIINLNNSNKIGFPDAHNSGSDSGVPSEYSSWAAPVGRILNSSPYEDIQSRSISASLEDIPNSGNLRGEDFTSESEDEDMNSPHPSQRSEGVSNPGYINTENQQQQQHQHHQQHQQQQAVLVNANGHHHPALPHPLNRAKTDTNLLASHSTLPGVASSQRTRTNSMIFQLNLANGAPGVANSLPNARSVSMISLNTAVNSAANVPISYPNLSGFNTDTQSIYSEAIGPNAYSSGLIGFGNNMGSQGSLSGVGYGGIGNMNHPHDDDHEEPQPTDPDVKKKWFMDTLCENLSTIYAILLFMIGCVLYVADLFTEQKTSMGEAFNVFLIIVQLLWLGYIHVDVRKYITTIASALEDAREKDVKGDPVQLETTAEGQYQLRINLPEPKRTFPQHYGFTSGRHGGSLYLKIGAAVFCLGYLIHSGLSLGQKVLYIVEENPAFDSCTCTQDVLMSVLQPIYAFYQLFFIFKFSNLIINRRKRLSRFALMHCISASLLFWVYTIIQETLQAINSKKAAYAEYHNITATTPSYSTTTILGDDLDSKEEKDDFDDDYIKPSYEAYESKANSLKINYGCSMTTPLTKMINDTTPYLYPFSIEYNILIVGIWILLWENIGRMDRHTHLPSVEMTYEDDNTKGISSNLIIYVDCHSSNRGLFAGLLMTVATIISIILFFIFTANDATKAHGLQVNGFSELIIHVIMIAVAILAFLAIKNLDLIKHGISNVDDLLLYICLPCIFLYAVFSMVPAFTYGKPLFVAVSIVQVVQAVIQTALIADGLRRCSNSSSLAAKKPGRELITFLVVANVALWLLETFEIKSEEGNYYKYKFYGKETWTLLSHMTLPLALFYRFHSSVCLVDIWKAGYEAEAEH